MVKNQVTFVLCLKMFFSGLFLSGFFTIWSWSLIFWRLFCPFSRFFLFCSNNNWQICFWRDKDFKANFYEKNMLLEKNIEMIIIASRFEDKKGQLSTSIQIWSQYGYFNQQPSDFNIKKDFKENSSIYIK